RRPPAPLLPLRRPRPGVAAVVRRVGQPGDGRPAGAVRGAAGIVVASLPGRTGAHRGIEASGAGFAGRAATSTHPSTWRTAPTARRGIGRADGMPWDGLC